VFNLNGVLTMTNVTFAGNTVEAGFLANGGTANTAGGGAVYNLSMKVGAAAPLEASLVAVANSILANTTGGSDVVNNQMYGFANINATGPNLVSTSVVNSGGLGTVSGTPFLVGNPNLGPLQNNGGLTMTMAPLPGSPALNAGSNEAVTAANLGGDSPFTDQRGSGFARIAKGRVDLGALEVQPAPHVPVVEILVNRVKQETRVDVVVDGALRRRFIPFKAFKGRVQVQRVDANGDGLLDVVARADINGRMQTRTFLT
jgi:hypothetical protein